MATVSVSTKPWRVGYATSATSSCETCKSTIDKEELRLGKMVRSSQIDRVIPIWNHADCIMSKANQIKSVDDVKDLELLHWEDQQKIRKYVEGSEASTKNFSTPSECGVEVSPTSCAACRTCGYLIGKGQMRVSTKPNGQGVRCPAWYHARCFIKMSTSIQLNKISGWNYLPDFHQAKLRSWVNNVPSTDNENKHEIPDKEVVQESISKAGLKRKKDAIGIPKSKVVKAEGIVSASPVNSSRNDGKSGSEDVQVAELESKLEAQTKVKGQRGVHESSGMQDSGHILEDAKSIYNTTLHMSDLSKGVNSYYILQIIQEDRGSGYYLFRKWGGAGNKKVRGCTLEKLTKSDAIRAFKQVFSEKTGNSWEAWESKENFQKQPGRFYPLDDYGVNKPVTKKIVNDAACQLAAPVKEEDEIIAVSRFTLKEDAPTGIPVKEHEIAVPGAAVSRLTLKEDAPTTVPVKEDKLTASGAVVSRLTLKKDTPTAMPVKEDEIAVPGVAVSRLTVKGDAPTIVPVKEDEIAVPVAAVSSFTLNEDIPTTSNLVTPHSSGVHSAEARVVTVSMEQAPVSTSAPSSSTHHVLTQVSHKMELFTLLEKGAHALIKGKDFSSVIRLLDLEIKENAQPSMIILLSELRETSEKIRGVDLEKTTAAMTSAAADLTEEKKLFEDCILPTKAIEYWRVHNKAKLANLEEQIRNLEEQIRTIQTARQNFLRFEEWLDQYARNIKEDDEQSETRMSKLLAELEELKKEQDIKSGFESILVRHFDTLVASLFKAQCSSTTKDASVELYTE